MVEILGTTWGAFIGITLVLFGGFAFMTGQSIAQSWKSHRAIVPYGLMLAFGCRFLHYALFEGTLLSPTGFLIDLAWALLVASCAYRMVRARKMVSQYPWLYEPSGLFGWRDKQSAKL